MAGDGVLKQIPKMLVEMIGMSRLFCNRIRLSFAASHVCIFIFLNLRVSRTFVI